MKGMASPTEDHRVIKRASSSREGNSFKIGKYVLGERLGSGGFGVVRKGINKETGEIVAIKVLDKTVLKLQDMTQNVKKEITLLTTLQHPNIVGGLEVLNSKSKILLVMEYVDGGDMHTILTERKRFTEEEARKLFHSLMDCLAYCHEKGVYHRDLKLENLLLTSSGELKVCDFGLASVRSMTAGNNELCKTIVGTEDFSPPEILKNLPYKGDKADMWSAAIVLYVMLAGYCPFHGRSPRELAQKIILCKYSFPRDFPKGPRRIIQHLLVPDGTRRPSASEVLGDEWILMESPQPIVETKLVTKMSSSSPWDSASDKASRTKSRSSSLRTSHASRHISHNREQRRGVRRYVSIKLSGSKGSSSINDSYGHPLYNALARANILNFFDLFKAMRDRASGIVVQDRKWRLRTFPKCFIGSEAATWIAEHQNISREDAIQLGQKFLDAGVFHHVVREHEFEDQYLFYRWHSDDPDNAWVANLRASYPRTVVPRPAHIVTFELLKELLDLCRTYQNLHDLREVDTLRIQRDSKFQKFAISAGELQHATLPQGSDEQKLSFLVNLHNLLWLQARIHIGEFDEIDYETLHRLARKFEYAVQGIRVSLEDLYASILTSMESPSFEDEEQQERRRSTVTPQKTTPIPYVQPLTRLFGRLNIDSEAELRDALRPTFTDPLVLFLMSSGSPDSPHIQPVTEEIFTEKHLNKVAASYLDGALLIDQEAQIVRYPPTVDQFRQLSRIFNDREFIDLLSDICEGNSTAIQLKGLIKRGRQLERPLTVLRTEQAESDRLGVMFALRDGQPLEISGSCETSSGASSELRIKVREPE